MSPVMATEATKSVRPSVRTTGSSASSGKLVMASTSVLMSFSKAVMSPPSRISAVSVPLPSVASQVVSSRSLMPETASSRRWQMAFSTSSAVAPR